MTRWPARERISPNQDDRGEPGRIDMLVLHYTGMPSAEAAIERLCDPAARVSAHYLIEENGTIWRLVPEARRAFHAGLSCWEGETGLNAVSLGVEIVNPGHEWGYRPFPEPQMASVEELCRDLVARHSIPAHRVVGHSDIAPNRKTDPGELFDWPRLARAGIGIWPAPAAPLPLDIDGALYLRGLAAIGYCTGEDCTGKDLGAPVIAAFQRRFRPECCDGRLDLATAARIGEVEGAFARARTMAPRPSDVEAQDLHQPAEIDRAVPHSREGEHPYQKPRGEHCRGPSSGKRR